jgi:hypothetical protein
MPGERHDGTYVHNKKEGEGYWRSITGKVREGIWKDDKLLKYVGPEIFEAQMKAKKMARLNASLAHIQPRATAAADAAPPDGQKRLTN